MAKRGTGAGMTQGERLAGTIFFVVYLLVMPLTFDRLFTLVKVLLDISVSSSVENAIYYYLIFAVTILIFHRYLRQTSDRFFKNFTRTLSTAVLGLVVFYGGNELMFRISRLFWQNPTNLNDVSIAAQISAAPRMTTLIVVFLAPFVEEVLFRGLVFGCLREKGRLLAYVVSSLLFAFLHVWQFILSGWSVTYLLLMLQYLIPGLVFAWAYEHSGNLWGSALLHIVTNALALWVMMT